ncbi:hypothetical protein ACHHYP_12703 [Achlya hypogyna]|uniref:Uncharacterized protein n=1 Tax=Achlya hypogyna TaxID=1202772 RepID=A0A1V9ZGD8_ACHHY|nr:hypothetical protein ACHHYP_12703 [Achlya hypogyna]
MRRSLTRSYIVVPLAKVSPSMTGGRITSWLQPVGSYVNCYDLLYEFDAQGVTDDDAKSAIKMEIECCDEGYLAVVFDPMSTGTESVSLGHSTTPLDAACRPMLAPDTPVALLCETEDEMYKVQAEFQALHEVKPKIMTWHAYLRDPRPSDGSCCS